MSLILRWFHDNGERHRAFFRQRGGGRELVIAARNWEHAFTELPVPAAARLEDLSEDALVSLARDARRHSDPAFGGRRPQAAAAD